MALVCFLSLLATERELTLPDLVCYFSDSDGMTSEGQAAEGARE